MTANNAILTGPLCPVCVGSGRGGKPTMVPWCEDCDMEASRIQSCPDCREGDSKAEEEYERLGYNDQHQTCYTECCATCDRCGAEGEFDFKPRGELPLCVACGGDGLAREYHQHQEAV